MDPLHPIIPISPDIGSVAPAPSVRRVQRDTGQGRREPERRQEREQPGHDEPSDDGHVDIVA